MKKRAMSMLLAIIMVLGMIPSFAMAYDTEEEALGAVDIYDGGTELSYLSMNGYIRKFIYTYYKHTDRNGVVKEIPAYCVNPNVYGVPQTVEPGQSIKYMAKEIGSDPKIVGIIANGYPTRSLAELGLENKEQGYYATKFALWCYIIESWDIGAAVISPNLTNPDEIARAKNMLRAANDIYTRGTSWTKVTQPSLVTEADQKNAYPVEINGQPYYQQVFTVKSETWVANLTIKVGFSDPSSVPPGVLIVDMNNDPIDHINVEDTGSGLQGKFKVIYPERVVMGQEGSVKLSLKADVYNHGVYYATCVQEGYEGILQNYMCDTDPLRPLDVAMYSNYGANPPPPPPPPGPDPKETSLKIVKVEAGTEKPLSGAMFEVKDPNGASIGSFVTNSLGEITIPLTLIGNYTVYEKQAPQGYLLSKEPAQNVQVVYGEQAKVTFVNDPYGDLIVKKYSTSGDNLPGAKVEIQHIESGATFTEMTNFSGEAIFTGLKPGAYRIREIAAPDGYVLNNTTYTQTVVTGETVTFPIVNGEKPGLKIRKYDTKTQDIMPGITFEIYKDGELLTTKKTDAMGEIVLVDLDPGTYMAKEVASDSHHVLDTYPQSIELHEDDGILELIFWNDQKPGVRLIKVDATTMKPLPNAKFRVKQVEGSYDEEHVSNEDGEVILTDLEPGAYVVKEITAPNGYLIDDAERTIVLDGNETARFVFTNTGKPSMRLVKLDSYNSKGLGGATFRIAKIEDGSHYIDRITDTNGEIYVADLEPGMYSVQELKAPEGYVIDPTEYHVELFPGRTSEVVVSNDRKPNLEICKRDAITGSPLGGVTFKVKKADSSTITTVKTGPDGKALIENLDPGVYEVWETAVPDDYLLNKEHQMITLVPNRTGTVYFHNFPKPTLTIKKLDSVTHEPIANVKFHVTYASNNTYSGEINDLGDYYTDKDGLIKIGKLKDGWYRVTEVEPAPGYSIKDPATQECYIEAGRGKILYFENTPLSALVVWKYDTVTKEAVEGATFQVKYLGGTTGTGGTVIGTYKTGVNGSFTVTNLKTGTYIVEEIASDDGHVIDTAPQTAYVGTNEQAVVQLYFGNAPKGSLLLKKIDSVTHEPMGDVEFKITDSKGTVIGDANGKFVTRADGTILVDGIAPGTTLVATETKTRDGYILDDVPQTATIKAGQTVTLEYRNHPKGTLVINKLDSKTKKPLKGVEFKVIYDDGRFVDQADGSISTKGKFITDSNGQIIIPHVDGALVVTETKTIPGYAIDNETRTQTVRVNPDDVQTLTFFNEPQGCLVITKVDSVTHKPLANVKFEIRGCGGCDYPTGTYRTDANGTIKLSKVPDGCYAITELEARDGYLLDDTVHVIRVQNAQCKEVTFENQPLGGLLVKKMDADTKEPLADAMFKITTGDGTVVGNSNGEFRTDERGYILIPDLEPGSYVVREIKAPEGYLLDDTPQTIQIKDHQTYELEFFDHAKGGLIVHKLDSVTKKPIEGVKFKITYADGQVVDNKNGHLSSNGLYWTDKQGQIKIDGLVGTVVVTEVETVDGYVIHEESRSQTVQINADDRQTLYFYNDPVGGAEIIKVNEDDRTERIPDTTFEIRRVDDELVKTVTTDDHGRVYVSLPDGAYYAKEIKAADGFKLDAAPHYFEVEDGRTSHLTITNKALSSIIIHKTDSVTGEGIYGVKFVLYDADHHPLDEYTTDDEGYIYIEEIPGGLSGRFYLRELEAAPGYELDKEYKHVFVKPGKTIEIEWTNTPITGQIQIVKQAAEYNTVTGTVPGTPLSGAVYEVVNPRNNKVIAHITTDARGIAATKPLPLGRYQLKEIKAPVYWQIDPTVHDVTLEYPGQIIRLSAFDKAAKLGVSITKRGNTSVLAGSQMRYDFTVGNTSNVALDKYFWHDRIPTDVARATVLTTGTYSARLNYRVMYKTNYSTEYKVLASNLLTSNAYSFALNAIPMQAGEVVTDVYFDFGRVPVGFQSVSSPSLHVQVNGTTVNGYLMVNRADTGGYYAGTWQTNNASWVTIIQRFWNLPSLPKTGF